MTDEQVRSEFRRIYGVPGKLRRWFDPVLRLLCFAGRHQWYYFAATVKTDARPEWRRLRWWQCRVCRKEVANAGYLQPKTPWPRGDQ